MTVKPAKESEDQRSCPDFQKLKELPASEFYMDTGDLREVDRCFSEKLKRFAELESEQESRGSSEENESPKSVGTFPFVHHQVLKIREEDSHLGEDIGEGMSTKVKLAVLHLTSHMDAFLYSRPILPSSPLSGKTAIKSFN